MAVIDRSAEVSAEYVGKRAYIGVRSEVGSKSIIGDSAVVHRGAMLPSHVIVLTMEIVTRPPTSLYFYRMCHQFILDDKCVTNGPLSNLNTN